MYCPKCSQTQASEEMRYCSGCGFPLLGVAELVASDGTAVVTSPDESGLTRRKIIVRGWAATAGLNLVFAPFVVVGVQSVEAVVIYLFFSLVLLLGGFAWLIYTRPAREGRENRGNDLRSREPHSALPAERYTTADTFGQGHLTNKLSAPATVTESTTKLLDPS